MTEPATRRLRLVLAYDGRPFSGFARQRDRRTVQDELEAALARLAGAPVTVVCAGRTDAGVHARGLGARGVRCPLLRPAAHLCLPGRRLRPSRSAQPRLRPELAAAARPRADACRGRTAAR